MLCGRCGRELSDTDAFCPSCGTKADVAPGNGSAPVRKSSPWGMLLAVLGVAAVVACVFCLLPAGDECSGPAGDDAEPTEVTEVTDTRTRVESKAVDRLPKGRQRMTTLITTTGKGENAKWGLRTSGSFVLTYRIVCDSEIIDKKTTPSGELKVVERRMLREFSEVLTVSDADAGFAVGECLTKPMIERIFSTLSPTRVAQPFVDGLKSLDNLSIRSLLRVFGADVESAAMSKIEGFLNSHLKQFLKARDFEGRVYITTYIQDPADGKPCMMKVVREDGKPLSEDERLVLRRANVFMDSQLMPDIHCNKGDSWTVNSGDFSCLLDPFVQGSYEGLATITRGDNDEAGNWKLSLQPTTIAVKTDGGKTTGHVELENGVAWYDNRNYRVIDMQIGGKGAMKNLSRHHFLFQARLEGLCKFVALLKTEALN